MSFSHVSRELSKPLNDITERNWPEKLKQKYKYRIFFFQFLAGNCSDACTIISIWINVLETLILIISILHTKFILVLCLRKIFWKRCFELTQFYWMFCILDLLSIREGLTADCRFTDCENKLRDKNRKKFIVFCFLNVLHWSKKLKGQPVLLLYSFAHYSSINEHKNMKLRESTCYEGIK